MDHEDRLFPHAFKVKDGWYIPDEDVRRVIRAGRPAGADQRSATHR